SADQNSPQIETVIAPYGQVVQTLLDASQPCWQQELDFGLIWSRPEAVIRSIQELLEGSPYDEDRLRNEVDDYCQKLALAVRRIKVVFVPTWVIPTIHTGQGMLDLRHQTGTS